MFAVSLPIRETTFSQVETDVPIAVTDCVVVVKGKSWNIDLELVCSASPVLKEILGPTAGRRNEIPVLSLNYEQPHVVETFVNYLKTAHLPHVDFESHEYDKIACLKHYTDVYILAGRLRVWELYRVAPQRWSNIAGTCLFGAFSVAALTGLIQHIYSQNPRIDTDFRLEALRLVASYRQRCLSMADSVKSNPEVRQKCSPEICEQVLEYEHQFPGLDSFLMLHEPLAWKLAKMYEEEVQRWIDLHDA